MGQISRYKRQVANTGNMATANIAAPVLSGFKNLEDLSNTIAQLAVAHQNTLDKAEYDKYEATFGTLMLEREIQYNQVKSQNVLANPNAETGNSPIQDMTKSLFEREKEDLASQRETFINQGSNARVRRALGAMWDQGSLEYLTGVANHQLKQTEVYQAQAQAANVKVHQATFLAKPTMDKESIAKLQSDLLAANNGDTAKTRQEVTASILEQGKQMARRDPKGFQQWVGDNEVLLDSAAPGVVSELQGISKQAIVDQRQDRKAQEADAAFYRSERERKAGNDMINLAWDTMLGVKGTSTTASMQAIRDNNNISGPLKQQLLGELQTFRITPTRTDATRHLIHNQAATLGMLDQAQLQQDVAIGLVSIGDARSLISFNKEQQDNLDAPAKEHFKRAIQYFKDRFTINNSMGFAIFKTDKDKIQNRIALNLLAKLWNDTEPGKRDAIFAYEEKDGAIYMPKIQGIYEQALRAPVEGFTTTGIKAKFAGMPDDKVNAEIDKVLGQ